MAITDGNGEYINIPTPTLGGKVFWETLETRGELRLQRNIITGHCRVLNSHDIRVAWGEEGAMKAYMKKKNPQPGEYKAQYGDIIGVHRLGVNGDASLYDHYGVYENDSCIYEYAAEDGDFGNRVTIHKTTMDKFLGNSKGYFVLVFPERHGRPGKVEHMFCGNLASVFSLDDLRYHIYSPEETIERAKSRLGESSYNLLNNNCEHFAIWCKTGIQESHQVEGFINYFLPHISILV